MKADEAALRRAAAERRRLAEVFGDVLAEGAGGGDDDEHDGARATAERRDADLLRDVPPHHGA